MGGKEGSRGYLFQAIIAVLNSLNDVDWHYVQIEPDTEKEKVDILWEYPNQKFKVTQVKSSINNFTKSEIILWAESLFEDISSAEVYEIILVGNTSNSLKKNINKVSSGKESMSKKLNPIKDKLKIKIISFDKELMTSGVQSGINKFISKHEYTVDYYTLENMANALIFQFFYLGIEGIKLSRKEFEDKLLEWLKNNYVKIFGSQNKLNKLEICFYNNSTNLFESEITNIKYEDLFQNIKESFKKETEKFIENVNSIKIIESKPDYGRASIRDSEGNILNRTYKDSNISKSQINFINEKLEILFNLKVHDDFYYVGNVLEPTIKMTGLFYENANTYSGSKSEIEKRYKIDELQNKLIAFSDFSRIYKIP
jgi:hypothetical protein